MTNKLLALLLLCCTGLELLAQEKSNFSLNQAVDYGLQNNVAFQNVQLNEKAQKALVKENISNGLPQIKAKFDYNYAFKLRTTIIPAGSFGSFQADDMEVTMGVPHNATASVELNQLLLDTRYFYGLQANKGIKQVASLNTQLKKSQLEQDIALAYYAVIISKEAVEKLKQNEKVLQKLIYENRELFKEGLIDELTLNRLELNLINLQTTINQNEINQENALLNLKNKIGFPVNDELTLSDNLDNFLLDVSNELNTEGKPEDRIEMQLMTIQDELNGYNVKQTISNYFPNVYGYASYGTVAQRNEFNLFNKGKWFQNGYVGIVFNFPIFDGLKAHHKAQQIKLNQQQNQNNLNNFKENYQLQVQVNKNNLKEAQKQLKTQTTNIQLAEKIFYKTNTMFAEGLGSSFELSQAQSDLTTAQINYAQAVYNLIVAHYNLKTTLKNN